jgi:hypothetical protein
MLTGPFNPSGARKAGHDAIAEACPRRKNRPLLRHRQIRVRHHVFRVLEDGAGVEERLEIEDVVVGHGRRPHVFLHSMTSGGSPRQRAGLPQDRSRRLGFKLMNIPRG